MAASRCSQAEICGSSELGRVEGGRSWRSSTDSLLLSRCASRVTVLADTHWLPGTFLLWSGILFLCSLVPRQSLRDFPKWGRALG